MCSICCLQFYNFNQDYTFTSSEKLTTITRLCSLESSNVDLGGMVLHKGEIAEMRTGEGKTLVAILPAYLNALTGKGVHVVTVNDYLARRDCEWVGQVPRFLGLKVGLIQRMYCIFLLF